MTSPPSPSCTSPWNWRPADPVRLEQPVGLLRLEGPGSLRVLHGQTSQAIEHARVGQWLRTCCISPTARMRALAEVLVDGEGAWLVISAGDAAMVRQALERVLFPADRVVLGALGQAVLAAPLEPMGPEGCWAPLPQGEGWRLGEAALVPEGVALPADLAARRPLDATEQERWRIQQGLPAAPAEINEGTNPFELGLAARVSLSKGCYLGQETLAKLASFDGVKQQLRRWHCPAPLPASGSHPSGEVAALLAPGALLRGRDGERAGTITSALRLPGGDGPEGGEWIGLALVRRQALNESRLRVGEGAASEGKGQGEGAVEVQISVPEEFVAPPVGAGGLQS